VLNNFSVKNGLKILVLVILFLKMPSRKFVTPNCKIFWSRRKFHQIFAKNVPKRNTLRSATSSIAARTVAAPIERIKILIQCQNEVVKHVRLFTLQFLNKNQQFDTWPRVAFLLSGVFVENIFPCLTIRDETILVK